MVRVTSSNHSTFAKSATSTESAFFVNVDYSRITVVQKLRTWALSENVSGTSNSELADDFHEVVHFSIHGSSTHSEVLLHTDASKEGQDHLREYRWFRLRFLGFDVSHDQISEASIALRNDFLRRTGKHSELVHGIDREAALLTLQAAGSDLQEPLDVFPAGRIGGQ